MNRHPAPPRPRHIPRTLFGPGGLTACLATTVTLVPAAQATPVPPTPSLLPLSPFATEPAQFPMWAVAAILAATIVLSVGTTLITLALEHIRRARERDRWARERDGPNGE